MDEFKSFFWTDEMEVRIDKALKHLIIEKSHNKGVHKCYTEDINKVSLGWKFKYSSKFFIMDFYQNIYIPSCFVEHQGSTYYFS